jgi:hypothetical protein
MKPSLTTRTQLLGLRYSSKSERAVNPEREDWLLIANKLATMRLIDAITETEIAGDALHDRGEPCWLEKLWERNGNDLTSQSDEPGQWSGSNFV